MNNLMEYSKSARLCTLLFVHSKANPQKFKPRSISGRAEATTLLLYCEQTLVT